MRPAWTDKWHEKWHEQWHDKLAERDRSWSHSLHRAAGKPGVVLVLGAVSRLGNGVIWYALVLMLPIVSPDTGFPCALRMVGLGLVNLVLYRIIKRHFARPRPYVACPGIRACTRSLDEFSFPSGHILHAVGFAVLLCRYFPAAGWVVWPFVALVGLSRVVLGLHYPSDVIVGAAIGWTLAMSVLVLF
jgi:undecaprenyl-diphosphatase